MTTRSERRPERERIKARRLRAIEWTREAARRGDERVVGGYIDTPARCSCWMCGNPPAHFGDRSVQERRHRWR